MKSIKLVYWCNDVENYGDLLSPYIIGRLSGRTIIQKNYFVGNWKSHIYHCIKALAHLDFGFQSRYHFPFEENLIGIGSILFSGNKHSKIWGAGFMSCEERCNGGLICAIRGKLSLEKIRNQISMGDSIKLLPKIAIGDPALLLPMLIKPEPIKRYDIGIIPHFSEFDFFKRNFGNRFHIIDLRSADVERITSDITSCGHILSTSLHGIIVAHAYGIPALWMEFTGLENRTNGFKFRDYFSSVEIKEYSPIRNLQESLESDESALDLFKKYAEYVLPCTDLSIIRKDLLDVAPFPITLK